MLFYTYKPNLKQELLSTNGWKMSSKNLTPARLPVAFPTPPFLPWLNWETSAKGFAGVNAD